MLIIKEVSNIDDVVYANWPLLPTHITKSYLNINHFKNLTYVVLKPVCI